jgi:hypothetical protein
LCYDSYVEAIAEESRAGGALGNLGEGVDGGSAEFFIGGTWLLARANDVALAPSGVAPARG